MPVSIVARRLCLSVLVLAAISPAQAQTNLAPNPGFELGTSTTIEGWSVAFLTASGATYDLTVPVESAPYSRVARLQVDSGAWAKLTTGQPGSIAVTPSKQYRFAALIKGAALQGCQSRRNAELQVTFWNGATRGATTVVTSWSPTETWEQMEGVVSVPATGVTAVSLELMQNFNALEPENPESNCLEPRGTFSWDSVEFRDESQYVAAQAAASVAQWRPWTGLIRTSDNWKAKGTKNPYRDVQIAIRYCTPNCAAPSYEDSGLAFWDPKPATSTKPAESGNVFRFRTARPANASSSSEWEWQATSCLVRTTPAGNPQQCQFMGYPLGAVPSGKFKVTRATTGPALYRLGFPRANGGSHSLWYRDGSTKFEWLADTAWEAPVNATLPDWISYVADRSAKGFSVIQVAPAAEYQSGMTQSSYKSFDFVSRTGCSVSATTAVPNECSRWNPGYWQKLESMILEANKKNLTVAIFGVIDPTDRGGQQGGYPALEEAETFAQNLAARLAGYAVVYSPGFDDRKGLSVPGGPTVADSMKAVGGILGGCTKSAGAWTCPTVSPSTLASMRLVGNQLAGSSALSDYDTFLAEPWLNIQLFQSGRGGNNPDNTGNCTIGGVSTFTRQQCAVHRAREMPLRDFRKTVPVRPSVNSEAAYEWHDDVSPISPNNPYGVRHTAFASLLSGAAGYTFGVTTDPNSAASDTNPSIIRWRDPLAILNTPGALRMRTLWNRIRQEPWEKMTPGYKDTLPADPIVTQPVEEQKKIVSASTIDRTYGLIYVPNSRSFEIRTGSGERFAGFRCNSTAWTKRLYNPRNDLDAFNVPNTVSATLGGCTQVATDRVRITRPVCPNEDVADIQGDCDWLLELRCATCGTAQLAEASEVGASVWVEEVSNGSSAVMAQLVEGGSVLQMGGSGPATRYEKAPRIARLADGSYRVVWQRGSTAPDTFDRIMYQTISATGVVGNWSSVTDPWQTNATDPSVAVSTDGSWAVAYTKHTGTADGADIYVALYALTGTTTFRANQDTAGRQAFPHIGFDRTGGLVVGWTSWSSDTAPSRVRIRRFDSAGNAIAGDEEGDAVDAFADHRLAAIRINAANMLDVEVNTVTPEGEWAGSYAQAFDTAGYQVGETTEIYVPTEE